MSKKRTTAAKVMAELNQRLDSPVTMITVGKHLHKQNILSRTAIPMPLVPDVNVKCHTYKTWLIYTAGQLLSTDHKLLCSITLSET
ncbi:hypothetical protein TNCV_1633711 [Trichonephila clavipes]|nr:hypothetical protein TNCV_1633711 [Trichonephila clavipes]